MSEFRCGTCGRRLVRRDDGALVCARCRLACARCGGELVVRLWSTGRIWICSGCRRLDQHQPRPYEEEP